MASIVRVVTEEVYQVILKLGLLDEKVAETEPKQDATDSLITKIPAEFKEEVKEALELLKTKGFSWNHLGQYTFNGQFEQDSDIANLVLSLTTPKANPSPQELKFQAILKQLGLFVQVSIPEDDSPTCERLSYPWKTFEKLRHFRNGSWANKQKQRHFDSVYVYYS